MEYRPFVPPAGQALCGVPGRAGAVEGEEFEMAVLALGGGHILEARLLPGIEKLPAAPGRLVGPLLPV